MPWVSVWEAAEMLTLSQRTVQRMILAKTLPSKLDQGRRLVLIGASDETALTTHDPAATPQVLSHLFDLWEGLAVLMVRAHRIVESMKQLQAVWEALPRQPDKPRLSYWEDLYRRITTCYQQVGRLVEKLRVERRVCHHVYCALMTIKLLWGELACRNGLEESASESRDADPQVLLHELLGHVRQLLIGCVSGQPIHPAQLDSRELS